MILSELRWLWFRAVSRESTFSVPLQQLRRLLRKQPNWLRGHMLFGEAALHAYELDQRDAVPRHLAAVRASAKALRLLAEQSGARMAQQALVLAQYFEAMVYFHSKDFAQALTLIEQLLQENKLQQLNPGQVQRGIESAGAAAMALDEQERAMQLFSLLPAEANSSVRDTALAYLAEQGEKPQNPQ